MNDQVVAEAVESIAVESIAHVCPLLESERTQVKHIVQFVIEKAHLQGFKEGWHEACMMDFPNRAVQASERGLLLELAGNVLEYKAAPKWLTELAQNAIAAVQSKPAQASKFVASEGSSGNASTPTKGAFTSEAAQASEQENHQCL